MKKILLLSGYDASSHRYWRKLLEEEIKDIEWTQLTLPDRHFYWRVRSNCLSFAFEHQALLEKKYDLILATSMVDLSTLRGFCPSLSSIPTMVYFHENQFAYPVNDKQPNLINVQITSIYTALCADKILFNSKYNRTTFLNGTQQLLKRMPDHVPKGITKKLEDNSEVLAVPIKPMTSLMKSKKNTRETFNKIPHLVWNHRWEYDKQPEVFFDALKELKHTGQPFKLHILGQSFRNQPDCFKEAKVFFSDEIETYGFQPKADFFRVLESSDIVVSSALHDFQGLSLQQAILSGCTPVAPNRVAYPEYIPNEYLYDISESQSEEVENLYLKLKQLIETNNYQQIDLSNYYAENLIPNYKKQFEALF